MINEKMLMKQIYTTDVVNLRDNDFEYTNGIVYAVCNYEMHDLIHKLFKEGVLENQRAWKPQRSRDLSKLFKVNDEIEIKKTKFKYDLGSSICDVFEYEGKKLFYNENYVKIFENVTYKIDKKQEEIPALRIYEGEKLMGIICPIRVLGDNDEA